MPFKIKPFTKITVSLLICFFLTSSVLAQSNHQSAQESYTKEFTSYRDAQDKYTSAKSSYQTFNTAVSKTAFFEATKILLTKTDDLYIAYLNFIKESILGVDWQNYQELENRIILNLDEEISFFNSHIQKVNDASTLEELPVLSAELTNRIENQTKLKAGKAIAYAEIVNTENVHNNLIRLSLEITGIIEQNKEHTQNSLLLNWQSEIADIDKIVTTNLEAAKKQNNQKDPNLLKQSELIDVLNFTQKAGENLKRSNNLLQEILTLL